MTKLEFLKKMVDIGRGKDANIHHDFLSTSTDENDNIRESNGGYYYKPFKMGGNAEIRYWVNSKRVSVTKNATK